MVKTIDFESQIDAIKEVLLELLIFGEYIDEETRYLMIGALTSYIISDEYYQGKDLDEASLLAGIIIETMNDYLSNGEYDEFIDYVKGKLLEQEMYEYLHELEL